MNQLLERCPERVFLLWLENVLIGYNDQIAVLTLYKDQDLAYEKTTQTKTIAKRE